MSNFIKYYRDKSSDSKEAKYEVYFHDIGREYKMDIRQISKDESITGLMNEKEFDEFIKDFEEVEYVE